MELILLLVFLIFGGAIFSAIQKAASNGLRLAQGKEPLYSGALQSKLEEEYIKGQLVYRFYFRGDVPVDRNRKIALSLVLRDKTTQEGEQEAMPIISFLEQVQERNTICFESRTDLDARPDSVWSEWIWVSAIPPALIQPPYGGRRRIEASLVFFDAEGGAEFEAGFLPKGTKVFAVLRETFEHQFDEPGYLEEKENQKECAELAVKIALAVAMSDGSLDDKEGEVIQAWMKKQLASKSADWQAEMRPRLNAALTESFQQAEAGSLSLSPLCERMQNIGTRKGKYDAIELCMDVMAADGIAEESELAVIKSIASALEIDIDDIERMKDERMVSSNLQASSGSPLALLGIGDDMSFKEKERRLRGEFQKWNDRLNSLEPGSERENAQRMLDLVAQARAQLKSEHR